jgi:membrane-associated protein
MSKLSSAFSDPLGFLKALFDPESLLQLLQDWGWLAYVLLFLIVFVETGLFIFFLPGDSLLFIAGFVCSLAGSALDIWILAPLLIVAAILGDSVGYSIGYHLGPKIFHFDDPPRIEKWSLTSIMKCLRSPGFWFNRKYLMQAHEFYERHGGKTIIYARFVPIVRTFAPLVAGAGSMNYRRFISFNVFGGVGWVISMMALGYWLGGLEIVKKNLEKAVLLVIFLSICPIFVEYYRSWKRKRTGPGA